MAVTKKNLFKKGNKVAVGKGRPKLPKEIRDFRAASLEDVCIEWRYLWSLPESHLKDEISDPETPSIRRWMAKIVLQGSNGVKTKDKASLIMFERILDRLYGRPKTSVDLGTHGSIHLQLAQIFNGTSEKKK